VVIDALTLDKIEEDLQGRSADEEATLYELVAAQRQFYGGPHPSVAQSLNMLASVLKNEGKLAESEKVRREALDMQRRLLGPDSAEVAQTLENLGELLVMENQLTNAEPMLSTAYNMRRKMFGDGNDLTVSSLVNLGTLYESEGKTDEETNLYLSLAGGKSASAANADYRLGLMYVYGKGVPRKAVEGAQWVFKSASLGHIEAEIEMGILYFYGSGVPRDENMALGWFRRATMSGANSGMKAVALKTLAGCYCTAGQGSKAIDTLQKILDSNPSDADAALSMAVLQIWYEENDDYEATRHNVMLSARADAEASVAEIIAKTYCLEPSTNTSLLQKALDLAQRGVNLRTNTPWLSWQQLSLGMAQYRLGQYTDAENTLALAEQDAGKFTDVPPTARFYRAMCLYSENRVDEAHQLFSQTESQMTPYPRDPDKPVIGNKPASYDVIITWLAYREARTLLNSSASN
jgi:tetratricopeptide (TPR) repeat protein